VASRPRRLAGIAACALAAACAGAPTSLEEEGGGAYGLDLQLVSPRGGAEVRNSAALVEVTGRVGRDWLLGADVVLALDLSNSTLLASGIDLDADGVVGTTHRFAEDGGGIGRPWRTWTSDADDAVVLAELEAASHLIRSLDSPDVRIGLLTYTGSPRVRTLLGTASRALEALDDVAIVEDWSGTDVSRALRESRDLFLAVPRQEGAERPRVVFLFSDGRPTVPHARHWAARAAIREARELTERRIAVCVLGFGESIVAEEPEEDDVAFLEELARTTGCQHVPVDSPDLLRFDRPPSAAAPSAFSLRNLTSGRPGRAVRLLQSGVFDGFVELVPGANTIEVSVVLPDGRRLTSQRVVHYQPTADPSAEEREETARLLLRLRDRAEQIDETQGAESEGAQPDSPPGE
jgi:Mg-chelatase subunit ChlD